MKKPIKVALVSRLADRKQHRIVQLPPLQVTFATVDGQLEHGEYLLEAANLTGAPDSAMAHYVSADQFKSMFRAGKRPDGSAVSEVMPFKSLGFMNDAELDALFEYLKTLDARPCGGR